MDIWFGFYRSKYMNKNKLLFLDYVKVKYPFYNKDSCSYAKFGLFSYVIKTSGS